MKILNLLLWVTQFGFSIMFPLCFFLILGVWLQTRFSLGLWITIVLGILGFMTSVSTTRSCIQTMLKEARRASGDDKKSPPPIAFNNHD